MNKNKFSLTAKAIFYVMFVFSWLPTLYSQSLPTDTSNLFSGAGNCALCHIAAGGAFTTQAGTDISPTTLWRSTMMGNAARDPLWQAKVTAEVAEHPALQTIIEDKCTTCHMPMGKKEAIHNGADHFAFDDGLADPLSMDGVSCTLCHQIQKNNLGEDESFSGGYEITDAHDIFGPYTSPTAMPMFNQVGYTPIYSEHVKNSELCATCHTLFTPYVDNQGQIAGYFPEQTPYLEWKNSVYPAESIECQTCHMPATEESMKISSRPNTLSTLRNPIYKHDFVGANVLMTQLLKQNGTEIGVTAADAHFDSTISKTLNMLQKQTINLAVQGDLTADTLNMIVSVENFSGHKFPTGFPSRRAWLHVIVKNQSSETIFESGEWNSVGEIISLDEGYEPHHQVIHTSDQVQIYEAIMQDVDNKVTYTLLRGAQYAKDNRLPPKGFSTQVENYQSIAIIGNAVTDPDFNLFDDGMEGSGADIVQYKIPVAGQGEELEATIEMRYQTLSYPFAQDLFTHQSSQISQFKRYFENLNMAPILVTSITEKFFSTGIKDKPNTTPKIFGIYRNHPNPFNSATIIQYTIIENTHINLQIHDLLGRKIRTILSGEYSPGTYQAIWDGTDTNGNSLPSGTYIASLRSNKESSFQRLLLLK